MTRHPLFPAIVALWFGALFGLGSLALRPALVEQVVMATGIDTLIPATAPPLGPTTRILIALAMTGLGALLGGSLARRITRPAPEVRQRRRGASVSASETAAPRALSRDDYFGAGAGLDSGRAAGDPAIQGNKRRSLALSDDVGPLEIHEAAPVPGRSQDAASETDHDIAAWELPADAALEDEDAEEDAFVQIAAPSGPLDLAEAREDAVLPFAPPAFTPPSFTPTSYAPPAFAPPEPETVARPFAAPPAAVWFDAAEPEAGETEPEVAVSGPSPAIAPVVAAPKVSRDDDVTAHGPETVDAAPFAPPQADARPAPALIPPVGAAAERLIASDFDELSPVELVERLAISLQRRRQAMVASAAPAVQAPVQAPVSSTEPVHPPASLAMPAAFRPLNFEAHGDEDEDGHDAALDSLPPRQFAWQGLPAAEPLFAKPAEETPEVEETCAPDTDALSETNREIDLEESYSSLLDLGRPSAQRASFIRIDDAEDDDGTVEPVVVFPGQRTPLAATSGASASAPGPAAPEPASQPPAGAARLFDRPSASSAIPARSVDQEEADRALRAALATLQRMSGAA